MGAWSLGQVANKSSERNGSIMSRSDIADAIRRVIRNELDDAERACKSGDTTRTLSEIDDAITKLKRIANDAEYDR